jgi:tRNA (adenine58-N1)-methyltransferase non-catalytic subunit
MTSESKVTEMAVEPPAPVASLPCHRDNWSDEMKAKYSDVPPSSCDVMNAGDWVLLNTSFKGILIAQVTASDTYRFNFGPGRRYNTKPLIGHAYGEVFEVKDDELLPADPSMSHLLADTEGDTAAAAATGTATATATTTTTTTATGASSTTVNADGTDAKNNEELASNKEIFDVNDGNQKLDHNDIERFKKTLTGDEIVEAVALNNANFQKKTQFSREKYLKRKREKYVATLIPQKTTALALCARYFQAYPHKIMYMQPEMLALMLTCANIRADSKTLLLETCQGLFTAAVAERHGGFGTIYALHPGSGPSSEIFSRCNLSPHTRSAVKFVTLPCVGEAHRYCAALEDHQQNVQPLDFETQLLQEADHNLKTTSTAPYLLPDGKNDIKRRKNNAESSSQSSTPAAAATTTTTTTDAATADATTDAATTTDTTTTAAPNQMVSGRAVSPFCPPNITSIAAKKNSKAEYRAQTIVELSQQCDNLIIASKFSPVHMFKALFPLLAPSGAFVIWSPYVEPLSELYIWLRKGRATKTQILDTFFRHHQVLPNRTHPLVRMKHGGGWILTGVKLHVSEQQITIQKQIDTAMQQKRQNRRSANNKRRGGFKRRR